MSVTQAEFARQEGVSRARVSQWISKRVIHLQSDGTIDPNEARAELRRNRDESRRIDYEAWAGSRRGEDGPPPPFTGNLVRDFGMTSLVAFYPFFIERMIPLQMGLFKELHLADKSAKAACVCFAFKVNELIHNFIRKDGLKQFFRDECGEDIDRFSSEVFFNGQRKKIYPCDDFDLEHPPIVQSHLKELGPDWPFDEGEKTAKGKK